MNYKFRVKITRIYESYGDWEVSFLYFSLFPLITGSGYVTFSQSTYNRWKDIPVDAMLNAILEFLKRKYQKPEVSKDLHTLTFPKYIKE